MCDRCKGAPKADDDTREYVLALKIYPSKKKGMVNKTTKKTHRYIETVNISLCQQCLKQRKKKRSIKALMWLLFAPLVTIVVYELLPLNENTMFCVGIGVCIWLVWFAFLLCRALSKTTYFDADASCLAYAHPLYVAFRGNVIEAFSIKKWERMNSCNKKD